MIHEEFSAPAHHPEVAAGDPFYAEARRQDERPGCFVCYEGLVYIGHLDMTEEGEEVEVIEAVPCRRCSA